MNRKENLETNPYIQTYLSTKKDGFETVEKGQFFQQTIVGWLMYT